MGNCQAVDAAALVIQHPSGKIDRLYWSVSASEVMKMNPGHYVSLIIPITEGCGGGTGGGGGSGGADENSDERTVRFTRVKLLRPNETLVLGRAYRLVTTQEVMKVLRAKKYAKMKNNNNNHANKLDSEPERKQGSSGGADPGMSELDNCQVTRKGRNSIGRSKSWRPSLQSISEAANP